MSVSHGQVIYDFFLVCEPSSQETDYSTFQIFFKKHVQKLKAYLACKQNNRPIPKRQHVATGDSLRRHGKVTGCSIMTTSSHSANISIGESLRAENHIIFRSSATESYHIIARTASIPTIHITRK